LAYYQLNNDEFLRNEFNRSQQKGEAWELEEDEDAARV
jgi:hypothetical protein